MAFGKKQHDKYTSPDQLDSELKEYILEKVKGGELPCALGFDIADKKGVPVSEVGVYADVLKIRLTKCQMGLFGHTPEKKRVKPVHPDPALKKAIEDALTQGKLSCQAAWQVAASQKCSKMDVSCACEAMEIKMYNCQLGAF